MMKLLLSLKHFNQVKQLGMIAFTSFIKQSIYSIIEPLTHITSLSIDQGVVPDEMKIAYVIPLFKAGDHSLYSNFWPVLVHLSFFTFFERVIYNGNRTKWSPIRSVIIRVINKIGRPRSGSPIC